MRKGFFFFLIIVIFTTFVCGLIFLSVQQEIRHTANDPQIQLAEDGAVELALGQMPTMVVGQKIDIGVSLAPFIIIFDNNGKALTSTGLLDGNIPTLPQGVFDNAKQNTDDRFTWQPAQSVRIAAVVKRFEGTKPGFILAGRSLREIEKREDQLMQEVTIAWALMVLLGLGLVILKNRMRIKG